MCLVVFKDLCGLPVPGQALRHDMILAQVLSQEAPGGRHGGRTWKSSTAPALPGWWGGEEQHGPALIVTPRNERGRRRIEDECERLSGSSRGALLGVPEITETSRHEEKSPTGQCWLGAEVMARLGPGEYREVGEEESRTHMYSRRIGKNY